MCRFAEGCEERCADVRVCKCADEEMCGYRDLYKVLLWRKFENGELFPLFFWQKRGLSSEAKTG
jgi:hypothetical protein